MGRYYGRKHACECFLFFFKQEAWTSLSTRDLWSYHTTRASFSFSTGSCEIYGRDKRILIDQRASLRGRELRKDCIPPQSCPRTVDRNHVAWITHIVISPGFRVLSSTWGGGISQEGRRRKRTSLLSFTSSSQLQGILM